MKNSLLILSLFTNLTLFSQQVDLYTNDFESNIPFDYQQGTANTFIIGECAGNGISSSGSNALYSTKGGTLPGCGVDGTEQFAFQEAAPGVSEVLFASVLIDARCTRYNKLTFDYKFGIQQTNARVLIVTRNGSGPWMSVDTLDLANDWTTSTIDLPISTFNTNFELGFSFEYNYNSATGIPLALDNIRVFGEPAIAEIENNSLAVCGQNTAVVSATPHSSGTGLWTVVSGAGAFNNPNAFSTGVNGLPNGTSVFAWTVTSAFCGNSSDTVTIVNSLPPSNANVQDTFYACSMQQMNISTSTPTAGTGMWSSPQGAVFTNASSPATLVTFIPSGWSQMIWTISSPGCPSKADTMNVFNTGGQRFLTNDTLICVGEGNVVVAVTTPSDSMQTENFLFAQGNGIITHNTDDTLTITNLQNGMNMLLYQTKHQLCPQEVDTLRINIIPCDGFEPVFPTVITPNGDGHNDLFIIQNLENIYPECVVTIFNRYGNVVYESVGYQEPWDGTFKGEKLPMGAYFFKLELKDSENKVYNGTISVIH